MGQIRGTEILRQVKARFEPFRGQLAGKKLLLTQQKIIWSQ
jgi:hypothetical protein